MCGRITDIVTGLRSFIDNPAYSRLRLRVWLRLGWWRIHCWLKRPARIRLLHWNACFELPPRWGGEGTTRIYVFREDYEVELRNLDRLVRPGQVVIDAGANCGIYTVAAGKLVGSTGQVVAIEPTPRVAATLRRNVEVNALNNVRVHEAALSDREGVGRLYHNRGPVAASLMKIGTDGADFTEVRTVSLDAIVAMDRLPRLDLIKLDIEGAEELALRGGKESIARWRPAIIFEVNPEAAMHAGSGEDATCKLLGEWGYRFFQMTPRGELQPVTQCATKQGESFCNYVALHPEAGGTGATGCPIS